MNEWEWQLLEDKTPLEYVNVLGAIASSQQSGYKW